MDVMYRKILIALIILPLAGCGSGDVVTAKQVRNQEEKALIALEDAHQKTIRLTELKEEFSVYNRDRLLEKLAIEAEQLQDDINKLEDIEHRSAVDDADKMKDDLEKERARVQEKIEQLKNKKKEDWSETVQDINVMIEQLKKEIASIMANVPAED